MSIERSAKATGMAPCDVNIGRTLAALGAKATVPRRSVVGAPCVCRWATAAYPVVIHTAEIHVPTTGRGLFDITRQVQSSIPSEAAEGLATVFIHHTSASLIVSENADPDVCRDLEAFFGRLVPDGDPLYAHTCEGPDDMPAHVRSVLTSTLSLIHI